MCLWFSGFQFRVSCSGVRILGCVFRASDFEFEASVLGFRVSGFGLRVSAFGYHLGGEVSFLARRVVRQSAFHCAVSRKSLSHIFSQSLWLVHGEAFRKVEFSSFECR